MASTNTWAPSPKHPGYLVQTIRRGAHTITVHRPVLSPEEQAKRLGQVKTAAEKLLISIYKGRKTK